MAENPFVYILKNRDNKILYVSSSSNIKVNIRSQINYREWGSDIFYISHFEVKRGGVKKSNQIKKGLIVGLNPLHNKTKYKDPEYSYVEKDFKFKQIRVIDYFSPEELSYVFRDNEDMRRSYESEQEESQINISEMTGLLLKNLEITSLDGIEKVLNAIPQSYKNNNSVEWLIFNITLSLIKNISEDETIFDEFENRMVRNSIHKITGE